MECRLKWLNPRRSLGTRCIQRPGHQVIACLTRTRLRRQLSYFAPRWLSPIPPTDNNFSSESVAFPQIWLSRCAVVVDSSDCFCGFSNNLALVHQHYPPLPFHHHHYYLSPPQFPTSLSPPSNHHGLNLKGQKERPFTSQHSTWSDPRPARLPACLLACLLASLPASLPICLLHTGVCNPSLRSFWPIVDRQQASSYQSISAEGNLEALLT